MLGIQCLLMMAVCGVVMGQAPTVNGTEALLFKPPAGYDSGKTEYLRIIHVDTNKHFMLLGSRDYLYNVSTLTMELNGEPFEWYPSNTDISFCQGDIVKYGRDCDSYIRAAIKKSDDLFHICASSAKVPSCKAFEYNSENRWVLRNEKVDMTERVPPIFPWSDFHMLTAQNGAMYIIGDYFALGSEWQPQLFRDNVYDAAGDIVVPGLRSHKTHSLFYVDYESQQGPKYTGLFETDRYVFMTYSEPAYETLRASSTERKTYSRIARVCKNDVGKGELPHDRDAEFQFSTLYKARLMCGNEGLHAKDDAQYLRQEYNGYYSTNVNEIAHSTASHVSSIVGADGDEVILAVFNSASNDNKVSAICAYKVSDMNRVFDSSDVVTYDKEVNPLLFKTTRPAAKCYEAGEDVSVESLDKYLLYDKVLPINGQTLFDGATNYRMTRIQVDWQVQAVDGRTYDVIFVSTDDGRLLKFVSYGLSEENSKYHLVEERVVFRGGEAVKEMELIHDDENKKHLLLNNFNATKRVSIEKCHMYTDCASCIGLRDPYCSWSPSLSSCVSTTHEATDKFQNIIDGVSPQCPTPTKSTIKPVETTTVPTVDVESQVGDTGAVQVVKEGGNDTAYITMIITLPIVVGGLAFLAGFYYSKRKFTSRTPHIDHELTNKSKEEALKCDAYQTLPKQSNLQLMNNLNGKHANVETTSIGERTLTRQKQVYV